MFEEVMIPRQVHKDEDTSSTTQEALQKFSIPLDVGFSEYMREIPKDHIIRLTTNVIFSTLMKFSAIDFVIDFGI